METANEEALHHHRSCHLLARRLAAIAARPVRLGGNSQWSGHSTLGERGRSCNRHRACSDGMAGNAHVSHQPCGGQQANSRAQLRGSRPLPRRQVFVVSNCLQAEGQLKHTGHNEQRRTAVSGRHGYLVRASATAV